jgi:uncharacterized protein YozE (UPF0346 family)
MGDFDEEDLAAKFRYATPTFVSSLPKYERGESERIKNSFKRGSMYNIRNLPTKLAPGNVDTNKHMQIAANLASKPTSTYKANVLPHSFSKLAYQYNDYDKEQDLHKCNIEEERVKVDCWSRKPFTTTARAKLKHEEVFKDANYKFPESYGEYKGVPKLDKIVRSDLNNASKFKHGNFNSYVKKQREVSKMDTRIWAKQIYDKLSTDWPHLRFKVKFTENDELLVCFPVEDNSLNVQFEATAPPPPDVCGSPGSTGIKNAQSTESFSAADGTESNCGTATPSLTLTEGPPVVAGSLVLKPDDPSDSKFKTDFNIICRYMRQMATHGIAAQFGLKKRGDRWRRLEVEAPPPAPASRRGTSAGSGPPSPPDSLPEPPPPVHLIVFSFYAPWVKVRIH